MGTLHAYKPVPLNAVAVEDAFWAQRQRINRERTLPAQYGQLKETGRIGAFRLAWRPGQEPVPHIFWDSDVGKWIEAASYSRATHPDAELDKRLDETIALIAGAQQPDGYLNVHFTVVEPEHRWTDLRDAHELYCAGHLIEAAVAHWRATGKSTLLDTLRHYADYIGAVFGRRAGQRRGYCGHEEIELALIKLYRATRERKYLELSRYFVDERGRQPHYFDRETELLRRSGRKHFFDKMFQEAGYKYDYRYNQSHLPVREQSEVVGHAVRAMYLYAAMADLAGELDDDALLAACKRLWLDLCLKRMYVTGGIGSSRKNEGFTAPYDLPNEAAYAETCAAIGLVFWSHRLLQLECDRRYGDVMERALYNGVLSGVSLDGERFFYENPLTSLGNHHRQPWFACSCCPPNIARLLASLGEYIYANNQSEIAVHLYVQGQGKVRIHGETIVVRQETRYPWEGLVKIGFAMERPAAFTLRLRIPDWCASARLHINGALADLDRHMDKGYTKFERLWQPDDQVLLEMDMPVTRVYAHPEVRQDLGYVALQRGPIVYCLEQVDHAEPVNRIMLPATSEFTPSFEQDLLDGVVVLRGEAVVAETNDWPDSLYRAGRPPAARRCALAAIPYFAWDNREAGQMRVWMPEA